MTVTRETGRIRSIRARGYARNYDMSAYGRFPIMLVLAVNRIWAPPGEQLVGSDAG